MASETPGLDPPVPSVDRLPGQSCQVLAAQSQRGFSSSWGDNESRGAGGRGSCVVERAWALLSRPPAPPAGLTDGVCVSGPHPWRAMCWGSNTLSMPPPPLSGDSGPSPLGGRDARPGSSPLWPRPPHLNVAVQLRDAGLPPPARPACLRGAAGGGGGRGGSEGTGTSRTFVGTGCQAGLGRRQPPQRGTEGTLDRGTEPEPSLPACWPSQPVRVPGTALPEGGVCSWTVPLGLWWPRREGSPKTGTRAGS